MGVYETPIDPSSKSKKKVKQQTDFLTKAILAFIITVYIGNINLIEKSKHLSPGMKNCFFILNQNEGTVFMQAIDAEKVYRINHQFIGKILYFKLQLDMFALTSVTCLHCLKRTMC